MITHRDRRVELQESKNARNSFGLLPQGYCQRNPLNLEMTTSGVLIILFLIYANNNQ